MYLLCWIPGGCQLDTKLKMRHYDPSQHLPISECCCAFPVEKDCHCRPTSGHGHSLGKVSSHGNLTASEESGPPQETHACEFLSPAPAFKRPRRRSCWGIDKLGNRAWRLRDCAGICVTVHSASSGHSLRFCLCFLRSSYCNCFLAWLHRSCDIFPPACGTAMKYFNKT